MTIPQITHLSLSGGGLCGIAYLGCIRFLQTEQLTNNIRHLSGTSIGAFFALAVALAIPYKELEILVKEQCIENPECTVPTCKIMNIFTTLGILNADILVSSLRKYISTQYEKPDLTFIELTKITGKNLVICASCVETASPVYFSVDASPDIGVLEAVKASMSVPLIVQPTKIGDKHYIDGAIVDNHPVACFGDPPPLSMLSIKVCSKVVVPKNVMSSFPDFLGCVLRTYFYHADKQHTKTKWSLVLKDSPLPFLPLKYTSDKVELHATENEIDEAIIYGYTKLHDWCRSHEIRT